MTESETIQFLESIRDAFTNFSFDARTVKLWHRFFGPFELSICKLALDKYVEVGRYAPHISDILPHARSLAMCGGSGRNKEVLARPELEIEWIMDVLGERYVNQRIKELIGDPTVKTCLSLVGRQDWLPKYKALKGELVEEAKRKLRTDPDAQSWPAPYGRVQESVQNNWLNFSRQE